MWHACMHFPRWDSCNFLKIYIHTNILRPSNFNSLIPNHLLKIIFCSTFLYNCSYHYARYFLLSIPYILNTLHVVFFKLNHICTFKLNNSRVVLIKLEGKRRRKMIIKMYGISRIQEIIDTCKCKWCLNISWLQNLKQLHSIKKGKEMVASEIRKRQRHSKPPHVLRDNLYQRCRSGPRLLPSFSVLSVN